MMWFYFISTAGFLFLFWIVLTQLKELEDRLKDIEETLEYEDDNDIQDAL